jgi:murein L,D-transpeptidase YafK
MIPDSKHFLAMDLGFPNDYDTYHGRTGKDMLVHGSGRHAGSFALGAANMSEIYTLAQAAMDDGQRFFRVNVFPFRMTDKRMELEWRRQPQWISFWQNLKEGYDFFENVNYPPDVAVQAGRYAFSLH